MAKRPPAYKGLPRFYRGDRRCSWAHRRLFDVYREELGPLVGIARVEAWRVAALGVEVEVATRTLAVARRIRETGKGRRPSARAVERLARRAALANLTYSAALDRLREMAKQNGHRHDLGAALAVDTRKVTP